MSGAITLRYQQKVKKICFRQNISAEDFSLLIASHFDIRGGRIAALKDKQGMLYELSYLSQRPYEIKPEIYNIIEDNSQVVSDIKYNSGSISMQQRQLGHLRSRSKTPPVKTIQQSYFSTLPQPQQQTQAFTTDLSATSPIYQQLSPQQLSQIQSQQFQNQSIVLQEKITTYANYVDDLYEFQEVFLQNDMDPEKKLVALFVLEEQMGSKYLEKHEPILLELNDKIDFFYTFSSREQNQLFIQNYITISIPFLVLYRGSKKVLEIGLTNSPEQLKRMLQKCCNKGVNSLFNSPQQSVFDHSQQYQVKQFSKSYQQQPVPEQPFDDQQEDNNNNDFLYQEANKDFENKTSNIINNNSNNINNNNNNANLINSGKMYVQGSESFQQLNDGSELTKQVIPYLDKMHTNNLLDNPQYYYFKCKTYEMPQEFLRTLFEDFSQITYQAFSEALLEQISKLCPPPVQLQASQNNQQYQARQNNFVEKQTRPQTQGANRKNKQKSSKKFHYDIESYLQMTEDFIDQGIIEEQQGTVIKTFILEENKEVFRLYNSYQSGVFGESIFQKKIKELADKLSSYLERPTSPFPRKQQLLKTLNNYVWSKIQDEDKQKFLYDLAYSGDEMLFSAFDVYESDNDIDDFIDTLMRIIEIYSKKQKDGAIENINTFYQTSSHTHDQLERTDSQRFTQQHFPGKQQQQQQLEQNAQQKTSEGHRGSWVQESNNIYTQNLNQLLSQTGNQQYKDNENCMEFLRFLESNMDALELEEYGMVLYMLQQNNKQLVQLIQQNDFQSKIDLFPIKLLVKEKLNEKMNFSFSQSDLQFIKMMKKNPKTSIYSIYQKFQVDGDLSEHLDDLREAVLLDQQFSLIPSRISSAENLSAIRIPPNTQIQSRMDILTKSNSNDNLLAEQETPSLKNATIWPEENLDFSAKNASQNQLFSQNYQPQSEQIQINRVHEHSAPNLNGHSGEFGSFQQQQQVNLIEQNQESDRKQERQNKFLQVQQKEILTDPIVVGESSASMKGSASPQSSSKKKALKVVTNSPFQKKNKRNSLLGLKQVGGGIMDSLVGVPIQNTVKFSDVPPANIIVRSAQENGYMKKKGMLSLKKVQEEQRKKYVIKENDLNEILAPEIEKFFNNSDYELEKNLIREIVTATSISESQEQQLYDLLHINHVILHSILLNYQKDNNAKDIEDDLQILFDLRVQEIDMKKVQKFNHFNAILRYIYEGELLLSRRDYNIYIYLFLAEDVSVFSAFEHYLVSRDEKELINTLKLISQISKTKFNLDYEEMESFTDSMFEQMKILYAYRKEFTVDEQILLEKSIKQFDENINQIFNQYKLDKNTKKFIEKLKELAKDKNSCEKQAIKDLIYHLRHHDMKHYQILYECVEKNDIKIKSIYQIYELNEDKIDFQENILLLYKTKYLENMTNKVISLCQQLGGSVAKINHLKELIQEENTIIASAYDVFLLKQNEDQAESEAEFKETIGVCLDQLQENLMPEKVYNYQQNN